MDHRTKQTREMKSFSWVKLLLIILPIWFVASMSIFVWKQFHKDTTPKVQHVMQKNIDEKSLLDDYQKIIKFLPERNQQSEAAKKNLLAMSSMIEGSMGMQNTGYEVKRWAGDDAGNALSLLEFHTVANKDAEQIWLIVPFDHAAEKSLPSAATLAITLASAQALVGTEGKRCLHFLLVPHAFADETLRKEMLKKIYHVITTTKNAKQVLTYEYRSNNGSLNLLGTDTTQIIFTETGKLLSTGEGAEQCMSDEQSLAGSLYQMNLPAAALIHGEEDEATSLDETALTPAANKLTETLKSLMFER